MHTSLEPELRARDPHARPPAHGREPDARPTARLDAIDLVRGLVIVLMVLDHVREYWSDTALLFQPTDLARTTPALFATRWVTHLCAPTFVFLAGASVHLQWARAADRGAVARFQLTRGAWLILLDLTLVSFALNFAAPFLLFEVIWAIGMGLILLTPLLRLRPAVVATLGAALLVGANLVTPAVFGIAARAEPATALAWRLLFVPGPATPLPGAVAYPSLPWFGVMCLGFGAGPLFLRATEGRRRALLAIGGVALALFVVLRTIGAWDAPWQPQSSAVFTLLAFLNVSKYPPSPLFVLVALGVTIPLCALLEPRGHAAPLARPATLVDRAVGRGRDLLRAFGRTPMFTFVVHLYLIHGAAMLVGVALGIPAAAFTHFLEDPAPLRAAGWGFGLPVVYAIWAATCVALYPLSRWYAALRAERPRWWMRYL